MRIEDEASYSTIEIEHAQDPKPFIETKLSFITAAPTERKECSF